MTWLLLGYGCVAYWHFRATLRCVTAWDSTATILINAMLSLTVGPMLLVPATVYGWIAK